ncbi:hypothetical protein EON73_01685 [bacterium]|nr:MAG: hypothetical protein EON73_01685 [bacterium]
MTKASDHFVQQFQENNSKVKEYVKKSFLGDYKRILELREQKYLNQIKSALKAEFEGKNEVLSAKLDKLEQTLERQGIKFDFESQNFLKINEQPKQEDDKQKSWGAKR